MNLKDKIEEMAFNFEEDDGTFKNSTIFLTDLFEIPEIKQLIIGGVVVPQGTLCDCEDHFFKVEARQCSECGELAREDLF